MQTDIIRAIARLIEFYKHESCGQCTPCREGRCFTSVSPSEQGFISVSVTVRVDGPSVLFL